MKKFTILFFLLFATISLKMSAGDDVTSNEQKPVEHPTSEDHNNWGGKLIKSPFGLGLNIQTKYVWRGMEMKCHNLSSQDVLQICDIGSK